MIPEWVEMVGIPKLVVRVDENDRLAANRLHSTFKTRSGLNKFDRPFVEAMSKMLGNSNVVGISERQYRNLWRLVYNHATRIAHHLEMSGEQSLAHVVDGSAFRNFAQGRLAGHLKLERIPEPGNLLHEARKKYPGRNDTIGNILRDVTPESPESIGVLADYIGDECSDPEWEARCRRFLEQILAAPSRKASVPRRTARRVQLCLALAYEFRACLPSLLCLPEWVCAGNMLACIMKGKLRKLSLHWGAFSNSEDLTCQFGSLSNISLMISMPQDAGTWSRLRFLVDWFVDQIKKGHDYEKLPRTPPANDPESVGAAHGRDSPLPF